MTDRPTAQELIDQPEKCEWCEWPTAALRSFRHPMQEGERFWACDVCWGPMGQYAGYPPQESSQIMRVLAWQTNYLADVSRLAVAQAILETGEKK